MLAIRELYTVSLIVLANFGRSNPNSHLLPPPWHADLANELVVFRASKWAGSTLGFHAPKLSATMLDLRALAMSAICPT